LLEAILLLLVMENTATRRISSLIATINPPEDKQFLFPEGTSSVGKKSDDDVVIVSAVRTAITKAKKGGFKDTHPTDMLAAVLKGVVDRVKLDPKQVQDIVVGTVLAPGGGATQARMAMFLAGFPEETSLATTNRQCSSGLQAVATIAAAIKNGYIDVGIGAGVETMSNHDMIASVGEINQKIFENAKAKDCLVSMGETSENVAAQFGVTRDEQDKMSYESQLKASKAQKEGKFDSEIIPVTTTIDDNGTKKTITVSKDDGIRATTLEGLKKLRPAFKENGTTTAGNSSQVSDGAAAVLLMRRSVAKKLGLTPLAAFRSFAVVGVPPSIMGIGPAVAIPEAVKKAGIKINEVDVFEINEAFASQAVYSVKKLGIPMEKVNPNGGAIALGHPLGCTGARQIATILPELKRSNGKYGVISMCIGTGMGAAAVIERE